MNICIGRYIMIEKIKSCKFSKGKALTLDQSPQGRLEVGNELVLKIWVKFRCERLEGGTHRTYSGNV